METMPTAETSVFRSCSVEQIRGVEVIATDMSAAFVESAKANIPLAEEKIVQDRFHVMKLATEAVDNVRRGEHRKLTAEGDDRLSCSRYLWLTGQENLTRPNENDSKQSIHRNSKRARLGPTRKCFATFGITTTPFRRRPSLRIGTNA